MTSRFCHSERSEESLSPSVETLHFVQGDKRMDVRRLRE